MAGRWPGQLRFSGCGEGGALRVLLLCRGPLGFRRCRCRRWEGMGKFAWGWWLCPTRAQLRAAHCTWSELYLLILLFLLLLAGLAAGLALGDSEPLPVWVGGGRDHDGPPLSGAGVSVLNCCHLPLELHVPRAAK